MMVSFFAVSFRKIPEHHFLNLNIDECFSTVLMKNGDPLRIYVKFNFKAEIWQKYPNKQSVPVLLRLYD